MKAATIEGMNVEASIKGKGRGFVLIEGPRFQGLML